MDALRKAESDKKAAAARAAGDPPLAGGGTTASFARSPNELRLEPLGERSSENIGTLGRGEYSQPLGSTTQRLSTSGRFREPVGDATSTDELSFVRAPASLGASETGTLTRPEIVTPRTVFAATHRPRSKPLAAGLGALLLFGIGGLGLLGYRYYFLAPPPIAIPSPRVALGVEQGLSEAPLSVVPAPEIPSANPTVVAGLAPVMVLPPPAADLTLGTALAPEVGRGVHAEMQVLAAAVATPAAPPSAVVPAAPGIASTRDFEMRSGDIRIARSTSALDPVRRRLTVAYAAFERGDLARAKHEYLVVLKTLPLQRDAQLGLGAIALAENRLPEAHRYYAAILTETPNDPLASAAMFLIEGGHGTRATEAKLKLLLDRGIEAPYLHFALGNLYAREQRWGDAQQAFFAAFRGQPRNADYVFNLAVSLDQLGQRKAALDYYRQAQGLRGPTTNFEGAAVAARIAALAAP